jgi:hypothetical protein
MEQEVIMNKNLQWPPAAQRLAALVGIELPPLTHEQQDAYHAWRKRGDDAVAAVYGGGTRVGPRDDARVSRS